MMERGGVYAGRVCVIRLKKGILEETLSNPTAIVKLVRDFKRYQETNEYSTDLFLSHVFDHLEMTSQFDFDGDRKLMKDYKGKIKQLLLSQKAANDMVILDYEKALGIAMDYFSEILNRRITIDLCDFKPTFGDFDATDEYCIIVDRDDRSFTEDQVESVIATCDEEHFRLVITNPCFELWLLLHFDVPRETIIECVQNGTLKSELSKHSRINECRIDEVFEYTSALGTARMKLRDYAEDLDSLKKPTSSGSGCIGSNIGRLLDDLTGGRYR